MRSTWSPMVWMCALLLWGAVQDANGSPLTSSDGGLLEGVIDTLGEVLGDLNALLGRLLENDADSWRNMDNFLVELPKKDLCRILPEFTKKWGILQDANGSPLGSNNGGLVESGTVFWIILDDFLAGQTKEFLQIKLSQFTSRFGP